MVKTHGVLLLLVISFLSASAQKGKKKEKEKVPVYNYVIDDPMDVFGRQPAPQNITNTVLVPEFYFAGDRHSGDTVIRQLCYNAANDLIRLDTLKDYHLLRYISTLQYYTEKDHTYRDAEGKLQPLPVEKIVYRYDKTGSDKWFSVDYATHKSTTLQEFINDIVKVDTVNATDPAMGNIITTIYRHYKVSPVKL